MYIYIVEFNYTQKKLLLSTAISAFTVYIYNIYKFCIV